MILEFVVFGVVGVLWVKVCCCFEIVVFFEILCRRLACCRGRVARFRSAFSSESLECFLDFCI